VEKNNVIGNADLLELISIYIPQKANFDSWYKHPWKSFHFTFIYKPWKDARATAIQSNGGTIILSPWPRFHVCFWLSHILVYLFYLCPSQNIIKINKQGYGW